MMLSGGEAEKEGGGGREGVMFSNVVRWCDQVDQRRIGMVRVEVETWTWIRHR
jgi:hypothetical protein